MASARGRHVGQDNASFLYLKLSGEYTGLLIFFNYGKIHTTKLLS